MSLANGREILAVPGPSVVPDRVLQAMHHASPNIYSGAMPDMLAAMVPDLKRLVRTVHQVAIYISNGHGAWEASLANVIAPGDRVLVAATGAFGHGWGDVARALGANVAVIDFGKSAAIDPARLHAALDADKSHSIRAVLVTHVDTSTSVRNDITAVRAVLDDLGHPALLMADCIASIGCERFEMDAWGVDVAITASQKGLMLPPGLSFVFFNERADERRGQLARASPYWDWRPRAWPEMGYQYFDGTPPTHLLSGLRVSLDMILNEEGLDAVLARHATLARAVWAAIEHWGRGDGPAQLNIAPPEVRSHAVTAVHIGSPSGTALRDCLSETMGVTLGIGLGMAPAGDPAWHGYFRIGHMGHVNAHMILGVLGAIEAAMMRLDLPFGDGALAAAAQVCAGRGRD